MVLPKTQQIEVYQESGGSEVAAFGQPFPQSWYAIAKSISLKRGGHRLVSFLGRDWILFRSSDNQIGMIARYCSHMGADLNEGCVQGQYLVCPLHRWEYSRNGDCNKTVLLSQSQTASLPSLAVQEWAGIVFVFPAKVPLYELPQTCVSSKAQFSSTMRIDVPIHWLAPAVNTFDLAHYSSVHNRELVGEPKVYSDNSNHLAVRFEARVIPRRWQDRLMKVMGFNTVDITVDCWGGAILLMRNHKTRIGAVLGMEPVGPSNSSFYLTTFSMDEKHRHIARFLLRVKLEIGRLVTAAFLSADVPVIKGMLPRSGALIPGLDDTAMRFWTYFQTLPKVTRNHED